MTTATATQRVLDRIDDLRDELIATLQDLVRIPSVVGHEGQAQDFMRQQFTRLGLELDVFEADRHVVSQHPAYIEVQWPYTNRPNVVGTLKGAGGGRSLIINSHVDVVSPEPVSAWTHGPWDAEIARGRMYGRGAADMKSGAVANLFALKAILDLDLRLRGDVILESVIEEEAGGGGGTLACFLRGYRADGLLITEPLGLAITVAHPGILYFRVRVEGRSAHAGRAHLGVNAIAEMVPIIEALAKLDRQRATDLHYELFERADPAARRSCHLNLGTIRAGDWPSTVPGSAELEARMSFVPGETEAQVKEQVEACIRDAATSDWLQAHPPTVEWFGWHCEPWTQAEDDPFVTAFRASAGRVLGAVPPVIGSTAGLDCRFGASFDTPSLSFGPIGGELHGADEWVDLESVVTTARVVAAFILDWCG